MPSEFKITRQVEFHETDMAGIMHFAHFFRWMESCETAFGRSLGLPFSSFASDQVAGWPRVAASCEYNAPLRFGDAAEVRLRVKEVRTSAVCYGFSFHKLVRGRPEKKPLARGEVTAVWVTADKKRGMIAAPIPPRVRARLKAASKSVRAG